MWYGVGHEGGGCGGGTARAMSLARMSWLLLRGQRWGIGAMEAGGVGAAVSVRVTGLCCSCVVTVESAAEARWTAAGETADAASNVGAFNPALELWKQVVAAARAVKCFERCSSNGREVSSARLGWSEAVRCDDEWRLGAAESDKFGAPGAPGLRRRPAPPPLLCRGIRTATATEAATAAATVTAAAFAAGAGADRRVGRVSSTVGM